MKLSVIIPVYNEKDTVIELVEITRAVPVGKEILVIDDGSSDGTRELLVRRYENTPGIKLLFHEKNRGKGSAIRTGIAEASGDILIVQDADLEYNPQDFLPILKKFEEAKADVVYGARFHHMSSLDFLKKWFQNAFFGAHHEIKRFHLFFGIQLLNGMAN